LVRVAPSALFAAHDGALISHGNWKICLSCDGDLFFEALFLEEAGVVTVARGGDAVGDEDGGAALHALAEAIEDALLGVGVYAGEGVVEDEDARVAED